MANPLTHVCCTGSTWYVINTDLAHILEAG